MIRLIGGASLIVLLTSGAFGQSAQAPRAFEVASVKPHDGPLHTIFGFSSSGTRVTLEAYLPIHLIMEAHSSATCPPDLRLEYIGLGLHGVTARIARGDRKERRSLSGKEKRHKNGFCFVKGLGVKEAEV